MGFEHLIEKVTQAEQALEGNERTAAADWRQFKRSWRQAWTPGRIVVAGLASGFLVGRTQPHKAATGHGVLNLMSALSGLMASGSAQEAAGQASEAAVHAQVTAEAVDPAIAVSPITAEPITRVVVKPDGELAAVASHEAMRSSGVL